MKYIIELGEEANMVQVINVTQNGNVYVGEKYVTELEELNSDYINEHFGDLQDTAYQKGINDGSLDVKQRVEGAYQKGFEDGKAQREHDDKIEVGDVVERYLNGKLDSTGIYLGEDGDYWNCLFWTGAVFGTFAYPKNQFKKTGRHFDIKSILEAMRYD